MGQQHFERAIPSRQVKSEYAEALLAANRTGSSANRTTCLRVRIFAFPLNTLLGSRALRHPQREMAQPLPPALDSK